jgi:hypothetical protein
MEGWRITAGKIDERVTIGGIYFFVRRSRVVKSAQSVVDKEYIRGCFGCLRQKWQ